MQTMFNECWKYNITKRKIQCKKIKVCMCQRGNN